LFFFLSFFQRKKEKLSIHCLIHQLCTLVSQKEPSSEPSSRDSQREHSILPIHISCFLVSSLGDFWSCFSQLSVIGFSLTCEGRHICMMPETALIRLPIFLFSSFSFSLLVFFILVFPKCWFLATFVLFFICACRAD